jgi:hypothetical protein
MSGWAECIDTARYQFELGNYEMALDAYKACIADLNKVIRNSADNALRNKAIEVSSMKVHRSVALLQQIYSKIRVFYCKTTDKFGPCPTSLEIF